MIDETGSNAWTPAGSAAATESTTESTGAATTQSASAEPAGFCQDCGRPLTRETARVVGTGVFCEPCLQVRLAGGAPGSAPYSAPGAPPPPPTSPVGTMPPAPGQPSPALAGVLGLIPGVGAMYNGQFAKGIAHIAIFAVLSFLSDHVSGIFGIMMAGWVFYQIFDAIHTARARRDGLPLPNTFGLNDIGERFAAGKWTAYTPPTTRPAAGPSDTVPPAAASTTAPGWNHVSPVPPAVAPPVPPQGSPYANWAGYMPPSAFANPYATPPVPAPAAEAPFAHGATAPVAPVLPARRFPVAAIWLIALGFLFLLANVVPSWHFSERWAAPVALLIFAGWALYRRISHIDQIRSTALVTGRPYVVAVVRVPLILATLALEFILQNLNIATVGQTWPLLLIVIGGLALIDRASFVPPAPAETAPFASPTPASSGAATSTGEPANKEVQP